MNRTKLILVAVVASLALAACTDAGPRAVEAGEYTIYVHARSLLPRGGDAALISGKLAIHEGCVVLQSPDGSQGYPVVWPSGTRIASTDPFAIRLPSGEELAIGEQVSGGGGFHYQETLELEIPPECLGEWQEVAVFNPDEELTKG